MNYRKTNFFEMFIGFCCITIVVVNMAAQDGVQSRSITSDDFASRRPAKANEPGKSNYAPKMKRIPYKFVRADKNLVRRRGSATPSIPPKNAQPMITEIGVTMWKLRPPTEGENGYFLSVLDEKKMRQRWLAERVDVEAVFAPADKVRFAIESSTSGYLYVIGRETYSDGSFGVPYSIFPESPADDNSVRPGMLFDFPDQRDDLPYLILNPKKPNYTGELLTVIISPKQLTFIKIDNDGNVKDSDDLRDLELGAEVHIFSRTDTADKLYSKAESASACGVKARQLEREKSAGKPCGAAQLTREEALPQSIYQVKGRSGQPAVAFVKLSVH